MSTLLEQFNEIEIKKMPIFEINWADYFGGDDDWEIFYIEADNNGLHCDALDIEWDDVFSLDEHLQKLYDLILENKFRENNQSEGE